MTVWTNWYGRETVPTFEEHCESFPKPPESYGPGGRPVETPSARRTWYGSPAFAEKTEKRLAQLRQIQPATATAVGPVWGVTRQTAQTALAALEKRGVVRRNGHQLINGTPADLWSAV